MRFGIYTNRTACDTLHEMRSCYETRNFAVLLGLIEELQHMCNRMEAGLSDIKDLQTLTEEKSRLKKEVKALDKKHKELTSVIDDTEETDDGTGD